MSQNAKTVFAAKRIWRRAERTLKSKRILHDTRTLGHSPCHFLFILFPPEETMILTHHIMIRFVIGSAGKTSAR